MAESNTNQSHNEGASDEGALSSSTMYHTDPEVIRLLARIEQKVTVLPDYEKRLRSLERWRWGLAGAIAGVGALIKAAPQWLK